MLRQSRVFGFALLVLVSLSASAPAQDFLGSTIRTIPNGNFELTGYPAWLMGRDDAPDRFGFAGRFGYGISDSFDVALQGGAFDDFTLAGFEAGYWLHRGSLNVLASAGAHKAMFEGTNDSTAFDLALQLGGRIDDRLDLTGGFAVSFESIDDTPDSDFTRLYLGPGLRYRLSDSFDLVAQAGIGLNDNSPHYFTIGATAYLPTSGSAGNRNRR